MRVMEIDTHSWPVRVQPRQPWFLSQTAPFVLSPGYCPMLSPRLLLICYLNQASVSCQYNVWSKRTKNVYRQKNKKEVNICMCTYVHMYACVCIYVCMRVCTYIFFSILEIFPVYTLIFFFFLPAYKGRPRMHRINLTTNIQPQPDSSDARTCI